MSICKAQDCDRPAIARHLCTKHYQRWRATGQTKDGPKGHAPTEARFWRHVEKSEGDECWLWTGALTHDGYGRFKVLIDGQWTHVGAHVYSWELVNGSWPEGLVSRHHCDIRNCVRPDHIQPGTNKENSTDMMARGRASRMHQLRGESHGKARLTEADVLWIRQSNWKTSDIARLFGVAYSTVHHVRSGVNWKHLK